MCSIQYAAYSVHCAVCKLPRASDGRTECTEAVWSVECTEAVLLILPAETELCCWKYCCALIQGYLVKLLFCDIIGKTKMLEKYKVKDATRIL